MKSSSNVCFRPVETDRDVAKVADAAASIWTEHFTPIIGAAQVDYMLARFQSEEAIRRQILNEGYTYYLMSEEDEVLGYMAVVRHGIATSLLLSKFYVHKHHRGRGVGRTAVDFIETLAREEGRPSIVLTVNRHNASSIAVYERFGFVVENALVQDIGGGFVMDDFLMRKPLALSAS